MRNLNLFNLTFLLFFLFTACQSSQPNEEQDNPISTEVHPDARFARAELKNQKASGFNGIWYYNQKLDNEYVYKYSGGLGTYCAKHQPFAVYRPEVDKTFFVFGGTDADNSTLLHMVSFYDHETRQVARPTLLLDKQTTDAHDNPVLTIDAEGYLWIFSTSHGTSRPSYIHRSEEPYSIERFIPVDPIRTEDDSTVVIDNFSYMQAWHIPGQGFVNFFTRYGYPADRTSCFMRSEDGIHWEKWQRVAAIKKGHYQISAASMNKAGSAFNFHPNTEEKNGLNWRTNLYYIETPDFGESWQAADGTPLEVPLTEISSAALVHDYLSEDLNVYLKDIQYDAEGNPVILYLTSRGYASGPQNDPRTWHTARWNGSQWIIHPITNSDNNYDMGSLYLDADGSWRIIAPTETGPQPYNPGGEIALWVSEDQGESWTMQKQLTQNSPYNHTYARRPVNAHPGFYALWADGHGRQPSESRLYFCDREGNVFMLPTEMKADMMAPIPYDQAM